MSELRFDGRVAVITGSGRGLGRAYAELLAARGARVVINDNGSAMTGGGSDPAPAHEAVEAIRAAGGEAVANTDSVTTPEGGKAIIETAMDHFGRIDVLIHNAGNSLVAPLDEITHDEFRLSVDIHLLGGFHVVRPAFPIMKQAGYGRVVLTGSIGGLYGMPGVVGYSVSKAGLIGLNNLVAIEGADFGVKSNIILPGAHTRMAADVDTSQMPPMTPEEVAPAVGWLAHESCSITGELLTSVAGRVARAMFAETPGVYKPSWTIEDIAANIDAIRNEDGLWTLDQLTGFGEHLMRSFAMARAG